VSIEVVAIQDADIYAVFAERHKTSVRVKTLIDFAIASFGGK
jgi:LysR family transcriptional activator of dmlA